MQKFGSIPFRVRDEEIELLFITSKKKRSWIFPKGEVISDETSDDTVMRETYEEAGVCGHLFSRLPLMSYKRGLQWALRRNHCVTYYPLFVTDLSSH